MRKPGITIIVAGLLGMVAVFCLIASTIWNEALRGTNLTKDLQVAMIMGNIEWVRQLMDKGANPNAASLDGATMIQLAADLERPDIVKVLIDRGAKVDIIGAACVGDVERVESLIKEGSINTTTPAWQNAAHVRCEGRLSESSNFAPRQRSGGRCEGQFR